jgi:hypothetical protein
MPMPDKIAAALENLIRWYGRHRIAWRLYVQAVQESRLDDDPIPSDQELRERAKQIEEGLYQEHLAEKPLPSRVRP